jgi:hypothetical protein
MTSRIKCRKSRQVGNAAGCAGKTAGRAGNAAG